MVPPTITVTTAIDANVPSLTFDPDQLHQVMLNLLSNALQAMDNRPGQLAVSYTQRTLNVAVKRGADELPPGRYGVVTVQDTGRGMDVTVLARIFEPFFTTKSTGTGLGLALVYRIIAAHGGTITATSTVDEGSTFTIYLPLGEAS
ncbi:hypothetical protein SD80_011655 [Scytonema tolypothrichoides VB-61278]|nr:hypothetical protein SD80_011655 [Scytonema tolypothrichoides VB-61278]